MGAAERHSESPRLRRARVAIVVAALIAGVATQAPTGAATQPVVAWPGTVVTYQSLLKGGTYPQAILDAVKAWNRQKLGVRFVRVRSHPEVQFRPTQGHCLLGKAGSAPYGFQVAQARVSLSLSCPDIVQRLLVSHEIGRVLGLPIDDTRCSLMNSHARSDGWTYAVPAKCSRTNPPPWLSKLIDPRTAALAKQIYAYPPAEAPIALSLSPDGLPQVEWDDAAPSGVATSAIARRALPCPTDNDLARGTSTVIYAAPPATGHHSVVDSTFPTTGGLQCFRAFSENAYGRAVPAPGGVEFEFGGPVANFTSTGAPAGSPTTFSDTSTAQQGTIASWSWDFGDPSSGTANTLTTTDPSLGTAPSHTYAQPGTYVVTLTVTDAGDHPGTMFQQIVIASAP